MGTTSEYSEVYIADSDGTDKVYMDIDPAAPYLNIFIDRGERRLIWGCSYIEDDTITAILTKYSTFADVKVYDGTTEYLCRWPETGGFIYDRTEKPSYSAKFELIIIEPASSKVYIADSGGANKVYMNIEPYPFPEPEIDKSKKYISWTCKYISSSNATLLKSKYPNDVEVSINNGSTKYLCRWPDGVDSLKIIPTTDGSLSLSVKFEIISQVSASPSQVYIADSGGGNKVYMDIDPYPFPEIKRDRKKKYLEWECSYITRAHANSIISKYPNDVEVSLDGSTKYLCRWVDGVDALLIGLSTKDVIVSFKVSFEILATVGASASGKIKIYDDDASNAVTLDSDPDPFPEIQKSRSGSSVKTCPYDSGGSLVSGEVIHFDGGVHISDGIIEFEAPYISSTTLTSLRTKYDRMEDVLVSLNSGTTKYRCAWGEGVSLQATATGSASYSVQFKFKIISVYT